MRVFRDRHDAGAQLASALHGYTDAADAVVLAHTRVSVPVAYEVATRLGLPLDVIEVERDQPCDHPLGDSAHGREHRTVRRDDDGDAAHVRARDRDLMDRTVRRDDDGDAAHVRARDRDLMDRTVRRDDDGDAAHVRDRDLIHRAVVRDDDGDAAHRRDLHRPVRRVDDGDSAHGRELDRVHRPVLRLDDGDAAHGRNRDLRHRTVLLVDDGDAARRMIGAIERVRELGARVVVAGVAVASPQVSLLLHTAADHAICVLSPQYIYATEAWYAEYAEPSAEDIRALLVAAAQSLSSARRRNFLGPVVDT